MLVKKYRKARLSPYSKLFFQLGLALALLLIYIAIEWKTVDRYIEEFDTTTIQPDEILDIPITERMLKTKPPPPPPPAPEQIEIIADNEEIEETVLESTETDQSEAIEVREDITDIEEFVEEEDVEEDVPFAIIEDAPVYPGCKGTKAQKKACLQEKIQKHVSKKYNTELASELGLAPGKKKVYVQFKIDKNGDITDIKARGPHKRLEKEAIRVVNLLPKMTPGKQRGRAVSVRYTLPITLVVQEN
ncbi:MAG: energy transducer TonB [Bacteroidota bacterium]